MNAIYRIFFTRAYKSVLKRRAQYNAEVNEWYTEGDGRSVESGGRGYRFPECIHGRSLWTDYDIACWECEDCLTDIQVAQDYARSQYKKYCARVEWMSNVPDGASDELKKAMIDFIVATMPKDSEAF